MLVQRSGHVENMSAYRMLADATYGQRWRDERYTRRDDMNDAVRALPCRRIPVQLRRGVMHSHRGNTLIKCINQSLPRHRCRRWRRWNFPLSVYLPICLVTTMENDIRVY